MRGPKSYDSSCVKNGVPINASRRVDGDVSMLALPRLANHMQIFNLEAVGDSSDAIKFVVTSLERPRQQPDPLTRYPFLLLSSS